MKEKALRVAPRVKDVVLDPGTVLLTCSRCEELVGIAPHIARDIAADDTCAWICTECWRTTQ